MILDRFLLTRGQSRSKNHLCHHVGMRSSEACDLNVLYLSCVMSRERFDQMFQSGSRPSQAAQKFHGLIVRGIGHQPDVTTRAVVAPPMTRTSSKKIWHSSYREDLDNIVYDYVSFINIPILRQATIALSTLVRIFRAPESTVIICDGMGVAQSLVALLGGWLKKFSCIAILTDLPTIRPKVQMSPIRARILSILAYISNFLVAKMDAYVLITSHMNSVINVSEKPWIIVEGAVEDYVDELVVGEAPPIEIVMYTGSTHRVYGLPALVEGFLAAHLGANFELHVYGQGDFDKELEEIARKHEQICYFGVVSNNEVVDRQKGAAVLVNPRPPGPEYTAYSFPSKNMEYMLSGVPTLTTDLPGMSSEYVPYVFLIEDPSPSGLTRALTDFFAIPRNERQAKGHAASEYVRSNKNNIKQGARIVEFARSILQNTEALMTDDFQGVAQQAEPRKSPPG